MNESPGYLIWSNEHGAWWAPNEHGYTASIVHAGRYTIQHANKILSKANAHCTGMVMNEYIIIPPSNLGFVPTSEDPELFETPTLTKEEFRAELESTIDRFVKGISEDK